MRLEELPGTVVAARYEVGALLGEGAMGAVFTARDRASGHRVALKVMKPGERGARLVPRFMREARLAQRLQHPHVVPVFAHGVAGEARDWFYVAMQLVDGVTLATFAGGGLSVGQIGSLACQLLRALAHVHARGVLHRDIKPENVLVERKADGRLAARLADFGLAAAIDEHLQADATRLTAEGSILGTPAYMAPEQVEGGGHLDGRVDLYALGVVLHELLTGRLPFDGAVRVMLVAKLRDDPPRPEGPWPAKLLDAVMRLIAREPADRFALAADALAALEPFAEDEPFEQATWSTLRASEDVGTAPTVAASAEPPPKRPEDALVGRDAALSQLEAIAKRVEGGAGQAVMVHGAPGVGKTALAAHVAIGLNEAGRFLVVRGRRPPRGDVVGALRHALDAYFGTHAQSRDAVAGRLAGVWPKVDAAAPADDVLALMRPDVEGVIDPRAACATFIRALRTLARERPVVVVLDDLEPDAGSAALLELFLFELALEPIAALMLLPLAEKRAAAPLWRAAAKLGRDAGSPHHALALETIPVDTLARHLEEVHGLSPRAALRAAERADGNPLFARHLAAQSGWSETAAHASTVEQAAPQSSGPHSGALPDVVHGLLEASLDERLAAVPDPDRAAGLLAWLAAIGTDVEVATLTAIAELDEADTEDDIDALIEAELLSDGGGDRVALSHRLLRDVLLSRIPARKKRRMCRRVAEAREASGAAAGVVGHHWAEAGEPERAVAAWLGAYDEAKQRGHGGAMAKWGSLALELIPADAPTRPALALEVARALRDDAELDAAEALVRPVADHGDPDLALEALELWAEIAQERFDIPKWRRLIERAEARATDASPRGKGAWRRAAAFLCNSTGDVQSGYAHAQAAMELSEDWAARVRALTRLAFAAMATGHADVLDDAVTRMAREVAGDRLRTEEVELVRFNAGAWRGSAAGVVPVFRAAIERHRRAGRFVKQLAAMIELSGAYWIEGDVESTLAVSGEATELARRFGLTVEQHRAVGMIILAHLSKRDAVAARALMQQAPDVGSTPPPVRFVYAGLAALEGDTAPLDTFVVDGGVGVLPPVWFFNLVLEVVADVVAEAGNHDLTTRLWTAIAARYARFGDIEAAERARGRASA